MAIQRAASIFFEGWWQAALYLCVRHCWGRGKAYKVGRCRKHWVLDHRHCMTKCPLCRVSFAQSPAFDIAMLPCLNVLQRLRLPLSRQAGEHLSALAAGHFKGDFKVGG